MSRVVGILGGGQLGCMLARAIVELGGTVILFDPDEDAPAHREFRTVRAPFHDRAALDRFAAMCDVVTYEREHLDVDSLRATSVASKVMPSLDVLAIAQDRAREKELFAAAGVPPVPHFVATGRASLLALESELSGGPLVAKSTQGGYDGKSQWLLSTPKELRELAHASLDDQAWVLERKVEILREASVVVGRARSGETYLFPVFENEHRDHILDLSFCPAELEVADELPPLALRLADRLSLVGLLTVEFFIARQADGKLVIYANEIAPRPHNSAHVSRRACVVSQFSLLAHLLLDEPIVGVAAWHTHGGAKSVPMATAEFYCMANLMGDLWLDRPKAPPAPVDEPPLELLLYGKREASRGRKMGHLIVAADSRAAVTEKARRARRSFQDSLTISAT